MQRTNQLGYIFVGLGIGMVMGLGWLFVRGELGLKPTLGVTNTIQDRVPAKVTPLAEIVEKSLEGTTGTYSVVIKNFKTGEIYERDSGRVYPSASIYKLWVMMTVFGEIEAGRLDPNLSLRETIPSLNNYFDIPPESAELTRGSVNFTVTSATRQMIAISHNYAAMTLVKKLGVDTVRGEIAEFGLKNTTVGGDPETTPKDVAVFLEKLYKGEVVSASASAAMVDLLLQQEKKEVIPAELPEGTKIAHKTGELEGVKHDAGIVYSDKGDYLIVLFSDSTIPAAAAKRMAGTSKVVYDYFRTN